MCPRDRSSNVSHSLGTYSFAEYTKLAEGDHENCYLLIDGIIYKVTEWLPKHPAGPDVIKNLSGKDASHVFRANHPKSTYNYLSKYKFGAVSDYENSEVIQAFNAFSDEIYSSGLMDANYWWFFGKTLISFAILALAVVFYKVGSDSSNVLVQLIGGAFLGIYFQQTAFLGHDTGHNGISHIRFYDTMYGVLVGPAMTGISIGWWKDSHNTHHSVPNVVQHDPDIQHLPVFAVTPRYFLSLYSYYHKRIMKFDAAARFLVSYQHFLFYPVMALARFNLYVQSMIFMLFKRCEWRKTELGATLVFWTWMYVLHSQLCSSVSVALLNLLLSHGIAGFLHVQICLSHFPMQTYSEVQYGKDTHCFLDTQLATTMDIDCSPVMDWLHGGLQFQTCHHLFPRVPRHNLRKLQSKVMQFCAQHGRTYHLMPFVAANRKMIAGLKETAMVAKKSAEGVNFKESMLWEGLCAQG